MISPLTDIGGNANIGGSIRCADGFYAKFKSAPHTGNTGTHFQMFRQPWTLQDQTTEVRIPSAAEVNLRAAAVPPASSSLKPDQEEIPACAAETLWAPSLPPSVRSSFDSCCVLHQRKHIFPGGSACRRLLRSSFCMSVFLSLLFWFSNLWLQPPDSCHTGSLMGSCTRTWSQITAEERHTSGAEGEPP